MNATHDTAKKWAAVCSTEPNTPLTRGAAPLGPSPDGQEVISSIRTVAAFTGEKKESKRYEAKVNEAMRTSILSGIG